MGNPFLLNNDQ